MGINLVKSARVLLLPPNSSDSRRLPAGGKKGGKGIRADLCVSAKYPALQIKPCKSFEGYEKKGLEQKKRPGKSTEKQPEKIELPLLKRNFKMFEKNAMFAHTLVHSSLIEILVKESKRKQYWRNAGRRKQQTGS